MVTVKQMKSDGTDYAAMQRDVAKLVKKGMSQENAVATVAYYSHTYRKYK